MASYAAVVSAFERHFLPRKNVICERALLNARKEQPQENVNAFATELFKMAEACDYRALKDELIRDRLSVGLRHVKLSETLPRDAELTLEKAITATRNSESVNLQHNEINSIEQSTIGVRELRTQATPKNRRNEAKALSRSGMGKRGGEHCKWWDGVRDHKETECPATNRRNHCEKKRPLCMCVSVEA